MHVSVLYLIPSLTLLSILIGIVYPQAGANVDLSAPPVDITSTTTHNSVPPSSPTPSSDASVSDDEDDIVPLPPSAAVSPKNGNVSALPDPSVCGFCGVKLANAFSRTRHENLVHKRVISPHAASSSSEGYATSVSTSPPAALSVQQPEISENAQVLEVNEEPGREVQVREVKEDDDAREEVSNGAPEQQQQAQGEDDEYLD